MAKQDLEDLNKEPQREKVFRIQAETEKLEAFEIAEAIFHKLDAMQRGLGAGSTLLLDPQEKDLRRD